MIDILVSILLSLGNVGAFAILAVGIVMIYRASKVLNLAHGAMIMFPAYVVAVMTGVEFQNASSPGAYRFLAAVIPAAALAPFVGSFAAKRLRFSFTIPIGSRRLVIGPPVVRIVSGVLSFLVALIALMSLAANGVPTPVALIIGLLSGGALGYLVERVFVRTLRPLGPTAQTVGTVAALGLVVAISAKLFGTGVQTSIKLVDPDLGINISQSFIPLGQIMLFVFAMLLTGGLILLLQKTDLGLVMRGTAENRRAASLMGIDPDKTTALTWILGGLLAGLSGILLASVTNLNPYTLSLQALPAFVAALLGGMASLPGAVAGAAIVGVTFSVVPILGPLEKMQGSPQLLLAVGAVAAMVTRGQKIVGGDVRSESVAAAGAGAKGNDMGALERARRPLMILGVLTFLVLPLVVDISIQQALNQAARNTLIAVSLVILIGWVGQISLGHAALVGIGGYATGWIAGGFGIPFPLSLPLAATVSAAVAALLGMVAVRVRGLFLAVATLIFSWMGSEFLFRQDWFIRHFKIDSVAIGKQGSFPYFDFSSARTFYFIAWAITGLALLAAANLRDSKTGRAFFAVQGSEMAAASLGVDVTRYKVLAFIVSGFIAGAAGNLLMTETLVLNPDNFAFNWSLLYVAIAVVGGLRSLGGAVGAGLLFAMLDVVQFKVSALNGYLEVFSAGLLAVVLLVYPGGLAALGRQIARALGRVRVVVIALQRIDLWIDVLLQDVAWARQRIAAKLRERMEAPVLEAAPELAVALPAPVAPAAPRPEPVPVSGGQDVLLEERTLDRDAAGRVATRTVVRAEHVTVRFGGLTAVNDVTLEVREREIVGLIGPNGAGKTVTFNSIAGIVTPTEGGIELYGQDVTNAPVHERAKLGIARTFQVLQLFPALTVFDNLLVATHLHNETDILHHVAAVPRAVEAERDARMRVREIVDLLGLGSVVGMYPGDLPFGTLRMVEVARALVTGLKFIMLDEAASGLDDKETDALVEALMKVRKQLGITILLIEHDVKLVMGVSDYVYVLDRGTLIAEGAPSVVQRDQKVIEAYLGTSGPAATDDEALEEVGS